MGERRQRVDGVRVRGLVVVSGEWWKRRWWWLQFCWRYFLLFWSEEVGREEREWVGGSVGFLLALGDQSYEPAVCPRSQRFCL